MSRHSSPSLLGLDAITFQTRFVGRWMRYSMAQQTVWTDEECTSRSSDEPKLMSSLAGLEGRESGGGGGKTPSTAFDVGGSSRRLSEVAHACIRPFKAVRCRRFAISNTIFIVRHRCILSPVSHHSLPQKTLTYHPPETYVEPHTRNTPCNGRYIRYSTRADVLSYFFKQRIPSRIATA